MAKSYKGVIRHFEAAPEQVRNYFPNFVELVRTYPWEVAVSYAFSRIEQAKRMTIYCGIVKLKDPGVKSALDSFRGVS